MCIKYDLLKWIVLIVGVSERAVVSTAKEGEIFLGSEICRMAESGMGHSLSCSTCLFGRKATKKCMGRMRELVLFLYLKLTF